MPTLKHVRSGDPLVIPAATFNTFVDAARDFLQRQRDVGREPGRDLRQAGIILVRNDSDVDIERGRPLGIAGPLIEPADNPAEFMGRSTLSGIIPTDEHVGRFVVPLEPLRPGAIGRAVIDGLAPALVRMYDDGDAYAEVDPDDEGRLASGPAGSAELLWVEPRADRADPDIARCLARIGVRSDFMLLVEIIPDGSTLKARPLIWDATTNGFRDDPPHPLRTIDAGPGGQLFSGARGYARRGPWNRVQNPGRSELIAVAGEFHGFLAKLTSAPDAEWSYTWQQVGVPDYFVPLADTNAGLTRAYDHAYYGRDPDVPLAQRVPLAQDTVVALRWDPERQHLFFIGAPEPTSGPCV